MKTTDQVRPVTVEQQRMSLDDMLRAVFVVSALGIVLIALVFGLLYLLYAAIVDNYGREGMQVVLGMAGVLVLVWCISWMQSGMRRRDMQDITRIIGAMTMHDITIQQSDDRGEVMRQLAPKLLDVASKRDAQDQQRAMAMFQGAQGLAKLMGPQVPFAGILADDNDDDLEDYRVKDDD